MTLPAILPRAAMEEAWAERERLGAESNLIVIVTAQALYGKEVVIDWVTRTCTPAKGG